MNDFSAVTQTITDDSFACSQDLLSRVTTQVFRSQESEFSIKQKYEAGKVTIKPPDVVVVAELALPG